MMLNIIYYRIFFVLLAFFLPEAGEHITVGLVLLDCKENISKSSKYFKINQSLIDEKIFRQ